MTCTQDSGLREDESRLSCVAPTRSLQQPLAWPGTRSRFPRLTRLLMAALAPAVVLVAGCGGRVAANSLGGTSEAAALSIHSASDQIDTNRTTRFTATLPDGQAARVTWSVSGGDLHAGAGTISRDGVYTPPSYLTDDSVEVQVTAALADKSAGSVPQVLPEAQSASLTVVPAFLQPLTPGNLALGPGGSVTISSSLSEVGGTGGIRFALASDRSGTPTTQGSLGKPHCVRGSVSGNNPTYTVCSVTYTAPSNLSGSGSVYVLGAVTGNPTLSWTRILLNASGITSNPAGHQGRLAVPVLLGSSSGVNTDYDSNLGRLTDCCGGTLGALLQDGGGNQFVLSNNHVFARSDQALAGETIIQPGLIDNGCTPYGVGPGTTPVATLTGYPLLASPATNVDAAIARVTPGLVDSKGSILEFGARQQDGTLAAAPPGISSSAGKGEAASLGMMVAKSGRTTGLTCAAVSAINVDVTVDYFTDCAETARSMSKTFTNQIAIAGTNFSDAGDSGALIVDSSNAEPVGLFFAGGTDVNGVEHAIASPAGDVLSALNAQVPEANGSPATYSFVGGADHEVSCLSYEASREDEDRIGNSGAALATLALPAADRERVEAALPLAQSLLGANNGIQRISVTSSKDHPGQGALAIFVDSAVAGPAAPVPIPHEIGGVTTVVVPVKSATGANATPQLRPAVIAQAVAVKQQVASTLMKSNAAVFGVGVGQSLDNPADAAIVLYVDRHKANVDLPDSIEGQRVRKILMDRLHVTRAHGAVEQGGNVRNGCAPRRPSSGVQDRLLDPAFLEDPIKLPE